ncbi:MAG: NAD(P)/FAD-dependent oxidoreductase [Gammaproteobacteria bacterium]|nr:MAG: NAD(P)/FAD-dependent oxidoreductase [Gammaproteobacteria bacterium]
MKASIMNIAIIGAGPLGIAIGRELLQQGFSGFTVFEKSAAAGGTWHVQDYPGLACDVWAHSYTYSYAPNPDWSAAFVRQPEIEQYLQRCAREFGVEPHIRFNTEVLSATLGDDLRWTLQLGDGHAEVFDVVINAMGNQYTPVYPPLENATAFKGESWHSARYNHHVDLAGKRVTVIGSAAAAIQIVPEIAPEVAHLTILQRSPNWIVPRNNKAYPAWAKSLFRRMPATLRLLRGIQGWLMNMVHGAVIMDSRRMRFFENMGRKFIASAIDDPALQQAVTPDHRYGCKRPLVSDDFYPALNRDNVTLLPEAAAGLTEDAVISRSGKVIPSDVIIYCTGYKVLDFDRFPVTGMNGQSFAQQMQQAPMAYKGILVPGFPNYFLGMGPNAVVLSVSYFKSAEANAACIVRLLRAMRDQGVQAIDAKPSLFESYNSWVGKQCKQFAWGSGTCQNYYTDAAGHSPFLYPDDYASFMKMRDAITLDEFTRLQH